MQIPIDYLLVLAISIMQAIVDILDIILGMIFGYISVAIALVINSLILILLEVEYVLASLFLIAFPRDGVTIYDNLCQSFQYTALLLFFIIPSCLSIIFGQVFFIIVTLIVAPCSIGFLGITNILNRTRPMTPVNSDLICMIRQPVDCLRFMRFFVFGGRCDAFRNQPGETFELSSLEIKKNEYKSFFVKNDEFSDELDNDLVTMVKKLKEEDCCILAAVPENKNKICLYKEYLEEENNGKEIWKLVKGCDYIFNYESLETWLRKCKIKKSNPMNNDNVENPPVYDNKTTRYRFCYVHKSGSEEGIYSPHLRNLIDEKKHNLSHRMDENPDESWSLWDSKGTPNK